MSKWIFITNPLCTAISLSLAVKYGGQRGKRVGSGWDGRGIALCSPSGLARNNTWHSFLFFFKRCHDLSWLSSNRLRQQGIMGVQRRAGVFGSQRIRENWEGGRKRGKKCKERKKEAEG